MSTPNSVGTPDPDDTHQPTTSTGADDAGRVIDFPAHGDRRPAMTATAVVDDHPGTAAPVVDAVIVDEDDAEDGEPRLPVDLPAPRHGGGELLPWKRREVERRPVIAPWLTKSEDVRAAGRWAAGWVWHATGYHVVRLPLYAGKLTARSPAGVLVASSRVRGWVGDAESAPLREAAIRASEPDQYLRLTAARADRVRVRRRLLTAAVLAASGGLLAVHVWAPTWLVLTLTAAAVLLLGWVGTPVDRPIAGRSVVRTQVQRVTSEVVVRALGALGLAELNKALNKGGPGVTFPAPITRDGPGWRADVDLPYGVTVSDIVERRDRLASGLRRPLGCVWPEPASEAHAGRLVLWVGDQDMAVAKPKPWPLAKGGSADLFRAIPFGVDQRGRLVSLVLVFESVLIGAKPRMGKTFAMRSSCSPQRSTPAYSSACSSSRAPATSRWSRTAATTTAPAPTRQPSTPAWTRSATSTANWTSARRRSGGCRESVPGEQGHPRTLRPQGSRTVPDLGIHRRVPGTVQPPRLKDEAARLAEAIIKRGPALGIILVLATQRPDASSLPTGVSANVGIRFCLRVMGQTENDMVLGTSSYKNGLRATTFGPRDKGIGYLVGPTDDPQIVRTAYIDGPTAEAIGVRARAQREAAGTLSGHALGEHDDVAEQRPRRSTSPTSPRSSAGRGPAVV